VERFDVRFGFFDNKATESQTQTNQDASQTKTRGDGPSLVHQSYPSDSQVLAHEKRRVASVVPDRNRLSLEAQDLCVRAALALQRETDCRLGVRIYLEKNIPSEAGLGGGSSDAATTLLALNQLWELNLDLARLMKIGLALGADVPFFLLQRHALVEGIGEVLEPIDLPAMRVVVVKPAAGVSTAAVFKHPLLRRDSPPWSKEKIIRTLLGSQVKDKDASVSSGTVQLEAYSFRNDMQAAAISLCPEIALAIKALEKRGLAARMTGSGSAVFALCEADFDVRFVQSSKGLARVCSNAV
jgi:4-diphosphocytidyl-2-C-methyl-D-erythritol kinase